MGIVWKLQISPFPGQRNKKSLQTSRLVQSILTCKIPSNLARTYWVTAHTNTKDILTCIWSQCCR